MKRILICLLALIVTISMSTATGFAVTTQASIATPTSVTAVAKSQKSIKVAWNKCNNATGYQVYRDAGSGFKKVKTTTARSFVNTKLTKNKLYKYKVRAYKKSNKKITYGKFSYVVTSKPARTNKKYSANVTKLNLKKTSATLQIGRTLKLTPVFKPSGALVSKKLVWTSSNTKVATVSSAGLVKAKAKGTCTITARAHNGLKAKAKIKVISASSMAKDIENMAKVTGTATDFAEKMGITLAYDDVYSDDSTGFRTAGSDAEHAASKYIAKTFKSIGLSDVKRIPVTVDKWQFNDAYMQLKYKDNDKTKSLRIDNMVSYASSGTVQNSDKDYTSLGIVDMGMGTKEDYEAYYESTGKSSMEGMIVLVGLNQWNEVWIDGPYMQAYYEGASAIISYPLNDKNGGYGLYNDKTINIQDLCAPDFKLPCTSISRNDAAKLKNIINKDSTAAAKLIVDNEVGDENGTSYNVVGKIEGTGNTGQQIVIAAHYDKYFFGFEDDCIATGLIAGMAKAMIDSGYKPFNDIIFVAHGAEEWGESATSTDWAIGSWEMITEAYPQWQGSTLALINYELPAIDDFNKNGIVRSTYEMGNIASDFLKSDLLGSIKPFYRDGLKIVNDDEATSTDCVSYQFNGVPFLMPRQENRTTWTQNRYHTQYDNYVSNDTFSKDGVYSKKLLEYDLALYSAMAMYIDGNPALTLDFGSRCDELEAAIKDTSKYASQEQVEQYNSALAALRTSSKECLAKGKAINAAYQKAYKTDDSKAMAAAREKGIKYNEKVLEIFGNIQKDLIGLAGYSDTEVFHKTVENNLEIYNSVIDALSDGTVTEDDIWLAAEINDWYEYYAYIFSDDVCQASYNTVMNTEVEDNWSSGKMSPQIENSWKTSMDAYALFNEGKTVSSDYQKQINEYTGYFNTLKSMHNDYLVEETAAMAKIKAVMDNAN